MSPVSDRSATRHDAAAQRRCRERVSAWDETNATPKSAEDPWAVPIYLDESNPRGHFDANRRWQGRLHHAGLAGVAWPEAYGGGGGESWMPRIVSDVADGYEESSGLEVRPLVQINRSDHFNEAFLSDIRVPVANVVGEIGGGWKPARTVTSNESAFIGGGRALATPILIDLARRFGRTSDPMIRQGIADHHTRARISKTMGEQIQQAIRRGQMPLVDPGLVKLMAADLKVRSGNLAVSIGGGTNEVQRNNIGEQSLWLPREPRPDKDTPLRDLPK